MVIQGHLILWTLASRYGFPLPSLPGSLNCKIMFQSHLFYVGVAVYIPVIVLVYLRFVLDTEEERNTKPMRQMQGGRGDFIMPRCQLQPYWKVFESSLVPAAAVQVEQFYDIQPWGQLYFLCAICCTYTSCPPFLMKGERTQLRTKLGYWGCRHDKFELKTSSS